MSWPGDVEEILRVLAPELVLFALLIDSLATAAAWSPLTLELLLDGVWQLHKVNWLRGEDSQEEWALLVLFVLGDLSVGDDHVVHWLLVMLWGEHTVLGDLSLSESLKALRCLQDDVVLVDLPQTVSLRLDADNQEVDRNVWLLGHLLVLLHKT